MEYADYAYGNEIDTKLNLGYASGTAPDVVRNVIASIAQRASFYQYLPFDSYIDGWEDKDDILPNAYEIGSFNGKKYGIPAVLDPSQERLL